MAIIKDAFDKARKESGKKDRKSLLVHMARVFLEGSSPVETGRKSTKPPYQVVLHHHLPSGISWCETAKGERPVSPQALEKALCDAVIRDTEEMPACKDIYGDRAIKGDPLRDIAHSLEIPQEPAELTRLECNENIEEGLEYVNELYGKMKRRKHDDCPGSKGPLRRVRARKTIPTALRKIVVERDGHCCQVPGCGSDHFTVLHHLDPVALGGTHEAHRLITLCWYCHDLVHEGKISVKGLAPDNLTWFFCGDSKPCDRGQVCGAPHKK